MQGVLKTSHKGGGNTRPWPFSFLPSWRGSPPGRCHCLFHLLAVAHPMYQSTTTAYISQRHADVITSEILLSSGLVFADSQCVSQYILCPLPCRDDSCGGTSCFSVSDGSNRIILMSLNANFSQTCFCIVCSFQVDCNLSIFFLNSCLKFLNPDSVKKMES